MNAFTLVRRLRLGPRELFRVFRAGRAYPLESLESLNQRYEELKRIPEVGLNSLLDGALRKKLAVLNFDLIRHEDGCLPTHDALALLPLLIAENPKEVLEIGTYTGHTTKAMAQNLPNAIIHTVDLPLDFSETNNDPHMPKDDLHLIRRRVVGREFKGHAVESRIRQHFGDTAKINFQEFGKPTFFFIDGSHTYEYTKQDTEKCFALCNGKGVFLWHDCDEGHPGVIKFLLEWRAAGRDVRRIAGTALAYWKI